MDDYGNIVDRGWEAEKNYFCLNVIVRDVGLTDAIEATRWREAADDSGAPGILVNLWNQWIDEAVDAFESGDGAALAQFSDANPSPAGAEYEGYMRG